MFQVGDKVLYPMYGAGIIDSIEEKEVLGVKGQYYLLNIPHVHMEIMIPVGKAEDLGIRQVVNCEIIDQVLSFLFQGDTDPVIFESNNRFYRDINKKKMKSGDIFQECEIIRDLTRKSKLHKLGMEDNNMLNSACQIITSEIVQAKGIEMEEAVEMLQEVISRAKEENEKQELLG
ncbi:CarD-like transcriptional regulator [Desulfitobacterium dichloroeliminans LMG P-21439]|uniref:CarD-like transcriptional regulator n=1 Tax=Desulfitobacterium dichloroeliminans (strain LMG P-21439 / DCA1) TaxID=871963 RepID=L0F9M9_DESDL|nr:CarD family transcriptional regulator [Desulfitobacterium dichloroeliminans]AGA69648.1 CarD-like transcriptional regulator [Desulfitobacterium dichloroeliminans LMG P-21439]